MDDTPRTRTMDVLTAEPSRGRAGARAAGPLDRWVLTRMRRRLQGIPLRVTLWDGTSTSLSDTAEAAEVFVKDRRTLLALVRDPAVAFGDAYTGGRLCGLAVPQPADRPDEGPHVTRPRPTL